MDNKKRPKYGGRKKGTPNKTTSTIKERLVSFIEDNFDKIQVDFDNLPPSERLIFFEKILKMIVPKPIDDKKNTEDYEFKGISGVIVEGYEDYEFKYED